jgi:nicotinic acid mononucleotide adenylyltransferase
MDIRNGENEVYQGIPSSFHYPSNKKYVMFTYVMRCGKLKEKSVLKIKLTILTLLMCIYVSTAHALVLEDLVKDGKLESTLSQKKIGYYIGSFDPLHLGHEAVVNQILEQNLCDYVLIYPAWGGDEYKNRTDVQVRLEMLFAAFANHPKAIVTKLTPTELQGALMKSDESLVAGKPSVKTTLVGTEYIGIIGSDTALETSKDLKKLSVFMRGIEMPEKYKEHTIGGIIAIPVKGFIVSLRAGDSIDSLKGIFSDRPIIKTISTDYIDLSSTKVRQMAFWMKVL